MKRLLLLPFLVAVTSLLSDEPAKPDAPAPQVDRVGFPKGYSENYQILRTVNRAKDKKVVTIYGNQQAASVQGADQLPYPYGSVIVMESSSVLTDDQGEPLVGADGYFKKNEVTGMHVMRREKSFGEAYGPNRAGEWEFVEYRADGSYITPPSKSASCSECHIKAGPERDFVFRGRLPEALGAGK